jgi:hypothetical protein
MDKAPQRSERGESNRVLLTKQPEAKAEMASSKQGSNDEMELDRRSRGTIPFALSAGSRLLETLTKDETPIAAYRKPSEGGK